MTETLRQAATELKTISALIMKLGRESFEQHMQREGYEISGLQFGVIRMLAMDGEHSLKELSQKFMLDPSTLVATVDTLERRDIVFRHRDAQDRRRVVIGLTEKGSELANRFHAVGDHDIIYQTLLQLGEPEVEQLLQHLRNLIQAMPEGEHLMDRICHRLRSAHALPTVEPTTSPVDSDAS